MNDLEALQKQRTDAEEFIARRERALRLADNPDFKHLVLNEFCVQECARYAQSSADPALKSEQRADALGIAQAAGHFRRWMSVVIQMGNQAESQLEAIDQAIDEVRSGSEA